MRFLSQELDLKSQTADFSVHSRLANIAVGAIMVLGGIAQFFPTSLSAVIVGVYVIIFGLSTFDPSPATILVLRSWQQY